MATVTVWLVIFPVLSNMLSEEDKQQILLIARQESNRIEKEGMEAHEQKVTVAGILMGVAWFVVTLASVWAMVNYCLFKAGVI